MKPTGAYTKRLRCSHHVSPLKDSTTLEYCPGKGTVPEVVITCVDFKPNNIHKDNALNYRLIR
eukprot:scaffold80871_cov18-Prasinocladus_malaysianus.AAC.1